MSICQNTLLMLFLPYLTRMGMVPLVTKSLWLLWKTNWNVIFFIVFWHLYLVHQMSKTNPEYTNFLEVWWLYLHFCCVLGWHIYHFPLIFCVLSILYANLVMTKMEYWLLFVFIFSYIFSTEQNKFINGPKKLFFSQFWVLYWFFVTTKLADEMPTEDITKM